MCEEYKKFLDNLTPSEYFAKQSAIKQDRQEKRRVARWEAKVKAWEKAKVEAEKKAEADAAAVEEALAAENKIVRKER